MREQGISAGVYVHMSASITNKAKSLMIRKISWCFFLLCSVCHAQGRMFPAGSLGTTSDQDTFKERWYSGNLNALQEPSLYQLAKDNKVECYRFLWLRSFNHPVSARLFRQGKGQWVLSLKIAGGAAGFHPAALIEDETLHLYDANVQRFLSQVESLGFWKAPNPVDDQKGTDGSQWIIEGVKDGKYHIVDRWSPTSGLARELGWQLVFDLGGLEVPKQEIY
jgi:hypothetical protein